MRPLPYPAGPGQRRIDTHVTLPTRPAGCATTQAARPVIPAANAQTGDCRWSRYVRHLNELSLTDCAGTV